jgi:hypothetical protein
LAGVQQVPRLEAGASATATVLLTIPPGTVPGQFLLLACADDLKAVAEASETDNCCASAARITIRP